LSAILKESQFQMRPMQDDDIDQVMAVELLAYAFPWTEGSMRDCLKSGYNCWVYQQEKRIIGHAIMSVAVGEANILNLCIHPEMQGRGLGRRLLQQMPNTCPSATGRYRFSGAAPLQSNGVQSI